MRIVKDDILMEADHIPCSKCIVNSMCTNSCDEFIEHISPLMEGKNIIMSHSDLANEIRKAIVHIPFKYVKVTFNRREKALERE